MTHHGEVHDEPGAHEWRDEDGTVHSAAFSCPKCGSSNLGCRPRSCRHPDMSDAYNRRYPQPTDGYAPAPREVVFEYDNAVKMVNHANQLGQWRGLLYGFAYGVMITAVLIAVIMAASGAC